MLLVCEPTLIYQPNSGSGVKAMGIEESDKVIASLAQHTNLIGFMPSFCPNTAIHWTFCSSL